MAPDRVNQQIAEAPNNSAFYVILGQCSAANSAMTEAAAALGKTLRSSQDNIDALLSWAKCRRRRVCTTAQRAATAGRLAYQQANDPRRVKEHLERVLQLTPGDTQADEICRALSKLSEREKIRSRKEKVSKYPDCLLIVPAKVAHRL
jgi:cytochrome c-type biogenesis protein CcmH/NrfG